MENLARSGSISRKGVLNEEVEKWNKIAQHNEDEEFISLNHFMSMAPRVWQAIHGHAYDYCGLDLKGKEVLDIGCGYGRSTMGFCEKGAIVTALDISPGMIELTRKKGEILGFTNQLRLVVGDANLLKPIGQFDLVFAGAILHHFINFEKDVSTIHASLKEGGRLVAYEPFDSLIAKLFRKIVPYKAKHRNENEWPLDKAKIRIIKNQFRELNIVRFNFFTALERFFLTKSNFLHTILTTLDKPLNIFGYFFCWHIVIIAKK